MSPLLFDVGDVMCFVLPTFYGNKYLFVQIYDIMTVLAQPLIGIKHNNAQ